MDKFSHAVLLHQQGKLIEAEVQYRVALEENPMQPEIYSNLAIILRRTGRVVQAEELNRMALRLRPDYPEALNNMGSLLCDQGRNLEAKSYIYRALQLRPNYASAFNNLGNLMMAERRVAEAISAYQTAIGICPDYVEAHWNISLAFLLQGNLRDGFREYEWRRKRADAGYPKYDKSEWRGEPLYGKTLLVYFEQGLGDTIQFSRFVPELSALGGRIVFQCQSELRRLLSGLKGLTQIVSVSDEPPFFDIHVPLLSVPYLLGIDSWEKIPRSVPYISIPQESVDNWRGRVRESGRLKVGLVWAGGHRPNEPDANLIDCRRSIAFEHYTPLLELQGIDFYSLQKGDFPFLVDAGVIDPMHDALDFLDTGALMVNLDLVITVDTSVAHLAGSLGKPVWVLSRFDGCWRWLEKREDSPWYPSLKIFRQKIAGDWQEVISRVREQLIDLVCTLCAGESGLPNEGYFGDKPQSLEIANTSENEPSCSPKIFSHSSSIETMSSVTDSGFIDVYCKSSVSPEDCNDKGVMSLVQRRIADAVTHFSEAIALQYNFPMAHFNLGIAFKEFNSLEKAISSFQRAIGLNPVFIEAHVSLGMALLLSGNFPSGWSEYEWRLKLKKVSYKAPPWDGQFRRGATLLVYCEQGIGDTIQFARYMPLIRQHEMQVVLLCPQVLHRLLTCISGPSAIVVDHEALPDYDYYCSLLSLPYLLRTDLSNLPSFTPYFHLPHNGLHLWANRLRELDQPIKIGLCWQGNPHHLDDRLRSLKLRQLECLASIPGISWVSLQNRPLLIEEKETAERLHLIDVHEHLDDFSESAALIHELDLVISVDTAVAHLAGALNRPVWTLIRFAPDWRWLLDRNDTPWYPSMLLFRQDSPDNWDTVIDKIRVTLGNVMASTLSRKVV